MIQDIYANPDFFPSRIRIQGSNKHCTYMPIYLANLVILLGHSTITRQIVSGPHQKGTYATSPHYYTAWNIKSHNNFLKPIDQSIYGNFIPTWENGLKLVAGNGDNKEAKEDGLHDKEDRVEDPSLLYVNILNNRIKMGYR
jgi:hypothetical protein